MRRGDHPTRRELLVPLEAAARLLPRRLQAWLGAPLAVLSLLFFPRSRKAIARNIEIVGGGKFSRGEIRRLTYRTFRHYGQYLLDYMLLPHMGRKELQAVIPRMEGEEELRRALQRGKGVVAVTAHLGNWEMGGALLASHGYPVSVATALEPDPGVLALREAIRRRIGVETLTLSDGAGAFSLVPLLAALRRNRIVALLADRSHSGATAWVPFFGRSTGFPLGPAILARASGAPIVPVFVTLGDDWIYDAVAEEPIWVDRTDERDADLRNATQRLAACFEAMIARHPDQWYNFFDIWQEERVDRSAYATKSDLPRTSV
ncbi:MAG: lysophospholipid acyltransferase family protein [Planctomycetota bacterium]|nr:lysophospholipid acyltransferase family protein [Planctomycetota bacterium]